MLSPSLARCTSFHLQGPHYSIEPFLDLLCLPGNVLNTVQTPNPIVGLVLDVQLLDLNGHEGMDPTSQVLYFTVILYIVDHVHTVFVTIAQLWKSSLQ